MKVSINWLQEWIDIKDLDPNEIAERLTMAGLEVDGIEYPGYGHDEIVVGKINSIEEHPKADRLVVCKVDVGAEEESTIVCGAKNMKVGDKVPVALPGANPPGIDFGIEAREVMGVPSEGMLCSEEELAMADSSEGLMILDESLTIGKPIFDVLEMRDVVIEIDLTPNRADCLSHYGVARELSALFNRPLKAERAAWESMEVAAGASELVTIEDLEGCPEYRFAVIEGIVVGPSPVWLQRRLTAVGQRSVNNIVDVTNYVLLDVGQPLHAFDLDKLEDERVVVRRARSGETLKAIDHNTYKLSEQDLVIADGRTPHAIAGVMGGAISEVSETTTRILLECAYFNPTDVRKAAKRHSLHSESSHRFERGIDSGAVEANLYRALGWMQKVQPESQEPPTIAVIGHEGREGMESRRVDLSVERARRILGIDLRAQDCARLLTSIGLTKVEEGGEVQTYLVPTYRGDLERSVDLVEELARLFGYDEIPARLPRLQVGEAHRTKGRRDRAETILRQETRRSLARVRHMLLDQELFEVVNYSFMGADDLTRLRLAGEDPRRDAVEVANPLVKTQAFMRTTLVASLLENVQTNFKKRRFDLALFEIGRRYFQNHERQTLGIALTGERKRHFSGTHRWDFFDMKGLVEAIGSFFALGNAIWRVPQNEEPFLHPGVQAEWVRDDVVLATIGQLHPKVAQKEGLDVPVFLAEIALDRLLELGPPAVKMEEPGKFPAVVRDFALLADRQYPYGKIHSAVEELARTSEPFGSLFRSMELFDVYDGEPVPEGKRSLAVKVTYRSDERTLTDKEIEVADREFLVFVEDRTGATLR